MATVTYERNLGPLPAFIVSRMKDYEASPPPQISQPAFYHGQPVVMSFLVSLGCYGSVLERTVHRNPVSVDPRFPTLCFQFYVYCRLFNPESHFPLLYSAPILVYREQRCSLHLELAREPETSDYFEPPIVCPPRFCGPLCTRL